MVRDGVARRQEWEGTETGIEEDRQARQGEEEGMMGIHRLQGGAHRLGEGMSGIGGVEEMVEDMGEGGRTRDRGRRGGRRHMIPGRDRGRGHRRRDEDLEGLEGKGLEQGTLGGEILRQGMGLVVEEVQGGGEVRAIVVIAVGVGAGVGLGGET